MEILYILIGLILLDVAVLIWGTDSTYRMNDPEWERRRGWQGFSR